MSEQLQRKMADLAARFAASAGEYRSALTTALEADDRANIVHHAHRLAGIAPMLGHPAIGEAAARLEESAKAGDYAPDAAALDRLLARLNG